MSRPLPYCHLLQGDCLDLFEDIPDHSIDLIVCDPPYGTTAAKWDKALPFDKLWPEIERILTPTGVALIFASQPFTTKLISSYPDYYRNLWYWKKDRVTGHLLTGRQPMRCIEEICVFGRGALSGATFNAQTTKREKPYIHGVRKRESALYKADPWKRGDAPFQSKTYDTIQPTHLLEFPRDHKQLVPTQKPVDLLKYLIRTYSNAGDTVLDFTMGSGSTGVAALEEDRNFVGFEMNEKHFDIASKRIEQTKANLRPAPVLDELDDELIQIVKAA